MNMERTSKRFLPTARLVAGALAAPVLLVVSLTQWSAIDETAMDSDTARGDTVGQYDTEDLPKREQQSAGWVFGRVIGFPGADRPTLARQPPLIPTR